MKKKTRGQIMTIKKTNEHKQRTKQKTTGDQTYYSSIQDAITIKSSRIESGQILDVADSLTIKKNTTNNNEQHTAKTKQSYTITKKQSINQTETE